MQEGEIMKHFHETKNGIRMGVVDDNPTKKHQHPLSTGSSSSPAVGSNKLHVVKGKMCGKAIEVKD